METRLTDSGRGSCRSYSTRLRQLAKCKNTETTLWWFPNSVLEDDRRIRQPLLRSGHASVDANSTPGFANFHECANVDSRQPLWGISYIAVAAPRIVFVLMNWT